MNFEEVITTMIEQIASGSQMPINILMGRERAVSRYGEVFDRDYFGTLDKDHQNLEVFVDYISSIDPFMLDLFKEYGIIDYKINWGLKQVMTDMEKAELDMKNFTNISSMMGFATLDECRLKAGLKPIKEIMKPEMANELFGLTPEAIGSMIPNLGIFKQQLVTEQTAPENEAAQNEQMLAENNNPENKARHEGTSVPSNAGSGAGKKSEARRQAAKEARRDSEFEDIDSAHNEIQRLRASMKAKDETFNEMLNTLQDSSNFVDESNHVLSTYKLEEELEIPRATLMRYLNKIKEYKRKK
jgi:hypothetical protein